MELQHSNSPTWKMRHAVEKLINTGIANMRERDLLQGRLKATAERREDFIAEASGLHSKPRHRRAIPEEGLMFRNKADLQQYFDEWEAKSKVAQSVKLGKLMEKAENLIIRVEVIKTKKEKCRIMENEGKKLPTTWKSVARLEEEEQKESNRLQRLRDDVLALERELEEESDSAFESDLA